MQMLNIEKSGNGLFSEAKPAFFSLSSSLTAAIFKKASGGLWVGGTFTAKGEWLKFAPNLLNTFFNDGAGEIIIHVSEVRGINCESGFLTDIITIQHVRGEFKFRCYGAREVTNTLLSYFQQFQR